MKIRVAILGFGFMGQMHARVYQALPDVEIVGVADSYPVNEQLDSMGICVPVFKSLGELLKNISTDVVDVCLPTDLHAGGVIEAARAGKHVFCEKPFALSVGDAQRALKIVDEAGVCLQVGQCIRFWPEYQALEKFIQSGSGGKLKSISLQRRASCPTYSREQWLLDTTRSFGAALDLHIHDTDYVLHLLGKPRGVHSVMRDDERKLSHIFTNYIYDDVVVSAEGGWDYPEKWGFQMAFQAVFENAVVEFDSQKTPALYVTKGDEAKVEMLFDKPDVKSSSPTIGNISSLGGYYNELAYFVGCIKNKRHPEIATGKQAIESLSVVLAEIESARKRQLVCMG